MITLLFILACHVPAPTADVDAPSGVLTFSITDENGDPIPAKLIFVDESGTSNDLFVNPDADPTKLASRKHAVYTLDGHGAITVPVGSWNVMASHGIEWSIDEVHIDIEEGGEYSWDAQLVHEIDTTGWVSGDFHLHTLTHSGHGDANMNERIISLVGEDVEFAVATDHNHNTDYQPTIDALEANDHLTAVVGNEVSTRYGHLNIFPLDAHAAVVDQSLQATELFAIIRAEKNDAGVVPVIQINHPRWGNIDYFGQRGLDPITGESNDDRWSWDFDCIEVLNENPGWGFHDAETTDVNVRSSRFSVLRDWYNMLNAGRNITAVGNSDSHTVIHNIAGIPRNYVYTGNDDAGTIDPAAVVRAIRSGRMSTTTGPFLRITANGYPMGSSVTLSQPFVDIHVDAQAASWIDLDIIRIIQNGEEVASITIDGKREGVLHIRPRIRIEATRDCWIIAIAEGDEPMKPFVLHGDRDVYPLAIANPIYIDADGDGIWTHPNKWAREAVADAEGNLQTLVTLYNNVNPTEAGLLVMAGAHDARVAGELIRLGLSSDHRIVKLAACSAARECADPELLPIVAAVIDHPKSDRFLAFAAWTACDTTDPDSGKLLLDRYIHRFEWKNAKRFVKEYPLRLHGDFVREWEVGGHFAITDNENRLDNLAMRQAPEPNVTHIVAPTTISGDPFVWEVVQTNSKGYLNLSKGKKTENTFAYARCWLWSDDAQEVAFTIGSDDACRIWIGDTLVWDDPSWQYAYPDYKRGDFVLQQGWNPVLVKILNGLKDTGFYFRVMDDEIKSSSQNPEE